MSMKIDINYQGMLHARRKESGNNLPANHLAGKTIEGELNGKAFSLTVSDEVIELRNEMDKFIENSQHVKNADPNDLFSYKPQDQWLIFSQYLHDSNAFDDLSNQEVYELEKILKNITDGLDSLTSGGISLYSGIHRQLNSYEAQLELASSTAALQHFSERFLSGDVKQGFDSLIQDYVKHNQEKVDNHQSIEERFYQARARLSLPKTSLSPQQAKEFSITNQIGKFQPGKEELMKLQEDYRELLTNLKDHTKVSEILEAARQMTIDFATQTVSQPDKADAGQWVNNRISGTLERIAGYFEMVLK